MRYQSSVEHAAQVLVEAQDAVNLHKKIGTPYHDPDYRAARAARGNALRSVRRAFLYRVEKPALIIRATVPPEIQRLGKLMYEEEWAARFFFHAMFQDESGKGAPVIGPFETKRMVEALLENDDEYCIPDWGQSPEELQARLNTKLPNILRGVVFTVERGRR